MIILTGKISGTEVGRIRVTGMEGNKSVEFSVSPSSSNTAGLQALQSVWARMKIADLAGQSLYAANSQLPYEIEQTALDYGLESPFTAFVAVDASHVTEDRPALSPESK